MEIEEVPLAPFPSIIIPLGEGPPRTREEGYPELYLEQITICGDKSYVTKRQIIPVSLTLQEFEERCTARGLSLEWYGETELDQCFYEQLSSMEIISQETVHRGADLNTESIPVLLKPEIKFNNPASEVEVDSQTETKLEEHQPLILDLKVTLEAEEKSQAVPAGFGGFEQEERESLIMKCQVKRERLRCLVNRLNIPEVIAEKQLAVVKEGGINKLLEASQSASPVPRVEVASENIQTPVIPQFSVGSDKHKVEGWKPGAEAEVKETQVNVEEDDLIIPTVNADSELELNEEKIAQESNTETPVEPDDCEPLPELRSNTSSSSLMAEEIDELFTLSPVSSDYEDEEDEPLEMGMLHPKYHKMYETSSSFETTHSVEGVNTQGHEELGKKVGKTPNDRPFVISDMLRSGMLDLSLMKFWMMENQINQRQHDEKIEKLEEQHIRNLEEDRRIRREEWEREKISKQINSPRSLRSKTQKVPNMKCLCCRVYSYTESPIGVVLQPYICQTCTRPLANEFCTQQQKDSTNLFPGMKAIDPSKFVTFKVPVVPVRKALKRLRKVSIPVPGRGRGFRKDKPKIIRKRKQTKSQVPN